MVIVVADIKRLDAAEPLIVPLAAVVANVAVPFRVSVCPFIFTIPFV